VPRPGSIAALIAFGAIIVLRDLGKISLPLPQNSRQVPRSVFGRRLTSAALRFGFELGTGVRTYVPAGAPYIVALALLLIADDLASALTAGVGFGIGRASMTLFRHWSQRGDEWDRRLDAELRWLVPVSSLMSAVAVSWLSLFGAS